MAYGQFPKVQTIKKFDTGEILDIGNYNLPANSRLKHTRHSLYIKGTQTGSERIRCRMHTTSDITKNYAVTDWITLNSLVSPPAADSLQIVRFDWPNVNINENFNYWFSLELDGYTRDANNFYVSVLFDYPFTTYASDTYNPPRSIESNIFVRFFVEKPIEVN